MLNLKHTLQFKYPIITRFLHAGPTHLTWISGKVSLLYDLLGQRTSLVLLEPFLASHKRPAGTEQATVRKLRL